MSKRVLQKYGDTEITLQVCVDWMNVTTSERGPRNMKLREPLNRPALYAKSG